MIVVILIGIVYALVISNLNPKNRLEIPRIETIKESLLTRWHPGERLDLFIYDHCSKYLLLIDGKSDEDLKIKLDPTQFKGLHTYRVDRYFDPKPYPFTPLLIDTEPQEVCFEFTIFPNQSSSSYIVQKGKKYLVFYPYLHPVKELSSMEEAIDALTKRNLTRIEPNEIE